MAIFARKKEVKKRTVPNLPELPELPELPDMGRDEESDFSETEQMEPSSYDDFEATSEIKTLPTFPDSKFGDSLSQEAVKSAIEPEKKKKLTMEIPSSHSFDFQRKPAKIEKEDDDYTPLPEKHEQKPVVIPRLDMPPPLRIQYSSNVPPPQTQNVPQRKTNDPVYVRIDKFKFALDGFQNIRGKIIEIEKYLQEIKEQKRREDEELKSWENEIEAIKLRIEAIDNKIFSKI